MNSPYVDVELQPDFVMRNGSIRIIAKDTAQCIHKAGTGVNDDLDARIGTISIKSVDFAEQLPVTNKAFSEWITLFDDIDDDEFDGEFGTDDEEMPMIYTQFTINPADAKSPLKGKSPTPKNEALTLGDDAKGMPQRTMPATTKAKPSNLRSRGSMKSPNLLGNEASPNRVSGKRRTVITESGSKQVVAAQSPRGMMTNLNQPA
jgi:hypothetical protein